MNLQKSVRQRPKAFEAAIKRLLLRASGSPENFNDREILAAICRTLVDYCAYCGDPSFGVKNICNPFDDPYVGAALLTNKGHLLGCYRKEEAGKTHSEVQTILAALDGAGTPETQRLKIRIDESLKHKTWLEGPQATSDFKGLFAEAGAIIRRYIVDANLGSDLIFFSTLEPCRDFESQPSCAHVISSFRPDKVVYGCDDTNDKGQGRNVLLQHGIVTLPNLAAERNLDVNRLFYVAVYCLQRLHQFGTDVTNSEDILYCIASLDDFPLLTKPTAIAREERLQIVPQYVPPIHVAPRWHSTPGHGDFSKAKVSTDRILFCNSYQEGWLRNYLAKHINLCRCLPGRIIVSDNGDSPIVSGNTNSFSETLRSLGILLTPDVMRKGRELVLARTRVQNREAELKRDDYWAGFTKITPNDDIRQKRYSGFNNDTSGIRKIISNAMLDSASSDGCIHQVTLIAMRHQALGGNPTKVRQILQTLQDPENAKFDPKKLRVHFEILHPPGSDIDEVKRSLDDDIKKSQLAASVDHRHEINEELPTWQKQRRDLDLIALGDRFDDIGKGETWRERRANGWHLANNLMADPFLVGEICERLRDMNQWQALTTVLNAVANCAGQELRGHFSSKRQRDFMAFLERIAQDLVSIRMVPAVAATNVDVIWRYAAACVRWAASNEAIDGLFKGALGEIIVGNEFLFKEVIDHAFCYANPIHGAHSKEGNLGSLDQRGISFLDTIIEKVSEKNCGPTTERLLRRLARALAIRGEPAMTQIATELLRQRLQKVPYDAFANELKRASAVTCSSLGEILVGYSHSTSTNGINELALQITTYIFATEHTSGGLLRTIVKEVGNGTEQGPQRSWSGDRRLVSRLVFDFLPESLVEPVLRGMATDESEALRWAAIQIAFAPETRLRLARIPRDAALKSNDPLAKLALLSARRQLAGIVEQTLQTNRHYWVEREFIQHFANEHLNPDQDWVMPTWARFTAIDFGVEAQKLLFLRGVNLSGGIESHVLEHPEVSKARESLASRKRIALVLPPLPTTTARAPGEDEKITAPASSSPPLGLGSIGTFLLAHGHYVELFDLHRRPDLNNRATTELLSFDIVGVSVVYSTVECAKWLSLKLGGEANQQDKKKPLVVFGGHAPTLNAHLFEDPDLQIAWDYLVKGDGEEPMLAIAEGRNHVSVLPNPNKRNNKSDKSLPALVGKAQSKTLKSLGDQDMEWNSMPWIDRKVFGRWQNGSPIEPAYSRNGNHREAHVVMSRGCKWECSFCTEAVIRGGGESRRSAEDVLAEVRSVIIQGASRVQFIDDNLLPQIAARREHDKNYCTDWSVSFLLGLKAIKLEYPEFQWRGIFRLEDFHKYDQQVEFWSDLLHQAGCNLLAFGIERGNESARKAFKMGLSLSNADIEAVVERLRAVGIMTKGYFIVGGPNENDQTTDESIHLALSARFTLAYFALYKAFREVRDYSSLRFKTLPDEFEAKCSAITYDSAPQWLGRRYAQERIQEAQQALQSLKRQQFKFSDLFKYNDLHDDLTLPTKLGRQVWPDNNLEGFLAAVRRCYFEFYMRREFPTIYKELLESGY